MGEGGAFFFGPLTKWPIRRNGFGLISQWIVCETSECFNLKGECPLSKQRQKKSWATAWQKKKPAANGLASKFQAVSLAHIAEALRPLAIRCSEPNLDPENARLP